jgi:hypothetical protein
MGRPGHTRKIWYMRPRGRLRLATRLSVLIAMSALAAVAAAGPSAIAVPADLFEQARTRGSVRVIVQVKPAEGTDQQAAADSVKRALLAELAGTRHRVVRELHGLNAIAIEASPEALQVLAVSPRVDCVTEDRLRRPLQ